MFAGVHESSHSSSQWAEWEYTACSQTTLYLADTNLIEEYTLLPTIKFDRRREIFSGRERITSMAHNNQSHLALLIRPYGIWSCGNDSEPDVHFEIRQTPSLQKIHRLAFDDYHSSDLVLCCALSQQNSGWLIVDPTYSRLLFTDRDGQLKMTIDRNQPELQRAIQCGDVLAATSENSIIYLFKLNFI